VENIIGLPGLTLLFFLLFSFVFFEPVHVHIPLEAPLGPGDMPQPDHLAQVVVNLGLMNLDDITQVLHRLCRFLALHQSVLSLVYWFLVDSNNHRPKKGLFLSTSQSAKDILHSRTVLAAGRIKPCKKSSLPLSSPPVEPQKPAQPLPADYLAAALGRRVNDLVVQPLMGALRVIMGNEFFNTILQAPFPEDDHPVQALGLDAADKKSPL
jgi:hypothetical protein